MKSGIRIILAFVLLLLVACGAEDKDLNRIDVNFDDDALVYSAKVEEGDFIYRLATTKAVYAQGEQVEITAELEYVGDLEKITISHASSPFYFPMTEIERGFEIDYPMDMPLIETELKKGEPLVTTYKGAGGYSDLDEEEFIEFMKQIMHNEFPKGTYLVNGYAEFKDETNDARYKIDSGIKFVVE